MGWDSKHGFGRKPKYKEHRRNLLPDALDAMPDKPCLMPAAQEILSQPKYGGAWYDHNCRWDDWALDRLTVLCSANANIEKAASALGRPPTNLVHRAIEMRLRPSFSWRSVLPESQRNRKRRSLSPKVLLAYPYIEKPTNENEIVRRVNDIVPRKMLDWMRADVCQEILLAIYEGTTSLVELEANRGDVKWFVRKFYKDYKPWQETQIGDQYGDDNRSYDEIASARNFTARNFNALHTHCSATQIEEIYDQEIHMTRARMASNGKSLSQSEVKRLVESGEWDGPVMSLAQYSGTHVVKRIRERYGLALTVDDVKALNRICKSRTPDAHDESGEFYAVEYKGRKLELVVDTGNARLITALPPGSIEKKLDQGVTMGRMRGVYVDRDEAQYALDGNHWQDYVGTYARQSN